MSKQTGLIILLLLILHGATAQEKWNYVEVDKKSYELYQQQKWTELIDFADQARENQIDFFYLQARSGIAYFNLKKYRKASLFFLKAWESDQSFEWLQEYLYYSLVYSGRSAEAMKYAQNFSESLQQNIGFAPKKLTRVALEAGYSTNPGFDKLTQAGHSEMAGVGDDYGEAFYLKNYHFESVDLSHHISPGISLNHNLTYIGLNRQQDVEWGDKNIFSAQTSQFQYFVNPNLVLGKKYYVAPSLNLIWGNFSYASGGISGNRRFFGNAAVYYRDLVFSTSAWSHFGNISPGIEYNYANINNEGFWQYSAWLTVYPFSNLSFYFTPRVYFKSSEENGFGFNTFGVSGGVQLGPVHLYGQYLNGEMENFIESGGYVVSNFPGRSEQKIMGSIFFPVGKKYQFVVRYISQDIIEKYQVYTNTTASRSIEYEYVKHTLTAGISWNF
jgi:tetratricopeptide (TPR) repeat protein